MKAMSLRFIAVLFALCITSLAVYAQNTKAYEARVAALEKEIDILDRQISANAAKSSNLLSELTMIRKKIANRKELVRPTMPGW